MSKSVSTLRLILGDQLNARHSWFENTDDSVLYLIAELKQETGYVRHHIQKVCAFFHAMQTFAEQLQQAGHRVLYLTLDDTAEHEALPHLIQQLADEHAIERFEFQRPDEYRLRQQLLNLELQGDIEIEEVDSEHFLLPFDELESEFEAGQHKKMEFFYRKMRQRFDLLMDGEEPLGGEWNFDKENRNKLNSYDLDAVPEPLTFANDVSSIIKRLEKHQIDCFGSAEEALLWPTSREQALELLEFFCTECLPRFGTFQDAMTANIPQQWSLYHSRLSFALNSKMLHPMEVIERAIEQFDGDADKISIAQIEGFVRQILGWREYVRGIYWVNMPDYAELNSLDATRDLPEYFWSGNTQMNCLRHALEQSLEYAYAHHIQRLMITGNFCLLAGIAPDQVDQWYLGIYIDAIEWVELPNTRGMSQFADGGIVGTKPYAAGGNYVRKMSDYCRDCAYDVKEKTTENACPLNSLYWHFMLRHREQLSNNRRIGMLYGSWDKQSKENQDATMKRAEWCLDNLGSL